MAFLRLIDIRKTFGEQVAVDRVDLDIEQGELISFLGPSGCGKSTTLRMIAGFEQPTVGRIELDGDDITVRPPNQRDVGMVFQSYALFPNMTVRDNIAFGLRVRRTGRDRIREKVAQLLDTIHLSDAGGRYPHELSGGMQQRVALARALAIEPRVLLLDEPLSALDAKIRASLRSEIRSIQQQLGITTVYVTHDQEEALAMSDRIVVMSQGRVEQVGSPGQVYNAPSTEFVARFVGTLNVIEGSVVDAGSGSVRIGGAILRSTAARSARTGDRVTFALRPESIDVASTASDGHAGGLPATVEEVSFLGSIVRIRVRVDGAEPDLLVDRFNDPATPLPDPGERVVLAVAPDAPVLLDPTMT